MSELLAVKIVRERERERRNEWKKTEREKTKEEEDVSSPGGSEDSLRPWPVRSST